MSSQSSGDPKPAPPPEAKVPAPEPQKQIPKSKRWNTKLIIGALVVLVLLIVGIPRILHGLETVSTDDAYVNSHVTFVAPRVPGPGDAGVRGRQYPREQR